MTKIKKSIIYILFVILVTMNYAHGFLPQYYNFEGTSISYSQYLEAAEEQYGSVLSIKILTTLVYPGACLGKLFHIIRFGPDLRPWPRIKRENKMMVSNSAAQTAELFF